MIDTRPRPEYGEYATPAEQAEAMGITVEELAAVAAPKAAPGKAVPDKTTAKKPRANSGDQAAPESTVPDSTAPDSKASGSTASGSTESAQFAPPRVEDAVPLPPPAAAPATAADPRRFDRSVSLTLVFIGVYLVVSSLAGLRQLGESMSTATAMLGADKFTEIALADSFGFWLSIIEPVILVITVGITLVRLRRGKLTFFVPLIGGAVGLIVYCVFVGILFLTDPALVSYTQSGP